MNKFTERIFPSVNMLCFVCYFLNIISSTNSDDRIITDIPLMGGIVIQKNTGCPFLLKCPLKRQLLFELQN